MLTSKIQQDQIAALKAKDEKKLSVIRFLTAALKNEEIAKQKPLTDEDVISVIRKQVKQLEDAATMFEKGGRPELATDNKNQITILSEYLPAELSDEQLKAEIDALIAENKALYDKNPKAIIGVVMGKLKTKAAPGRIMALLNARS